MCNSPLGFIYLFGAIIVVLYFIVMHNSKNNKSGSNKKSDSDYHSPTIDKLSKIKPLNESNTTSKSNANKTVADKEESKPKIIIAPREERLTKEQITELSNSKIIVKSNDNTNLKVSKSALDKTYDTQISPKKKSKVDSETKAVIFGIVFRIATLISFIILLHLDIKYTIVFLIFILPPIFAEIICTGFWIFAFIRSFFIPVSSLPIYIVTLICLSIFIIGLILYLYLWIYKDKSENKHTALNVATFTLIPLVIIGIIFAVVQINSLNNHNYSNVNNTSNKIIVNSISNYVSPGDTAHICVSAKPNKEYSISVEYSSGNSEAEGLENKTTDSAGRVSWSWKVGTNTYSGAYPITITNCETLSEYETFYFTVK